jgi:hypothetical protein
MATTTPNYGWVVPTSTDLVKDGATAIETLGDSADATVKALNPETTLGDLAYRSATANTNTRLAIGSTSQVLTVAGGVPTWATPATPAAGLTLITTNSFTTSSAVNVDSCFTSTYQNYRLIVDITAAASNPICTVRLRAGGTTNSADYNSAGWDVNTSGGSGTAGGTSAIFAMNTSSAIAGFTFDLLNPQMTLNTKAMAQGWTDESGGLKMRVMSGYSTVTTAFDGFALVPHAGTISGNYWVYGYQKA